jgi:phage terminase small subunit
MPNPRKPNTVHKLQGTFDSRRHAPKNGVQQGHPRKPDTLSPRASAIWDERCAVLVELGFLSIADGPILATFCELYAQFTEDPAGCQSAKIAQMRACMSELGMTPSSRDRVAVVPKEQKNKFADIA